MRVHPSQQAVSGGVTKNLLSGVAKLGFAAEALVEWESSSEDGRGPRELPYALVLAPRSSLPQLRAEEEPPASTEAR